MKRCALLLFSCLFLLCQITVGQEEKTDPDLAKLKKTYTSSKAKIEFQQKSGLQEAKTAYLASLDASLKDVQKQGDLDNYTAIAEEKKRFSEAGTILPPKDITNEHIKKAALAYKEVADKKAGTANNSLWKLIKQYQSALEGLVKEKVKAGDIAGAKIVKEELNKIEFIAADYEVTEEPKEKPAAKPKPRQMPVVKNIPLMGSNMKLGKWRKQSVKVRKGWSVTVTAKASKSFSDVKFSNRSDSFIVRIGEAGPQMYFKTDGSYSGTSEPTVVANKDCYLYIQHNQLNRFTVTVTLTPPQ